MFKQTEKFEDIKKSMEEAKNIDELIAAADRVRSNILITEDQEKELREIYRAISKNMKYYSRVREPKRGN